MQINLGDNSVVKESQFGDGNTMYNGTAPSNIPEEYWGEHNTSSLNQKNMSEEQQAVVHDAINCVKAKDTKGLSSFIKKNKGGFMANVLSNFVSTGLIEAFKQLMRAI